MNWLLFGAAGAAIAKDPQAGERVLYLLIYAVCYFMPLVPAVFAGVERSACEAIKHQLWAKVSIATAVALGIAGLIYIGVVFPPDQIPSLAMVVAMASLVWGLLTIRKAKKGWPSKCNLQNP